MEERHDDKTGQQKNKSSIYRYTNYTDALMTRQTDKDRITWKRDMMTRQANRKTATQANKSKQNRFTYITCKSNLKMRGVIENMCIVQIWIV